jgi:hypothetical protein
MRIWVGFMWHKMGYGGDYFIKNEIKFEKGENFFIG